MDQRILALAAVLLLGGPSVGCLSKDSVVSPAGPGRHILFIGNSLTYTNDLPGTVASIATAAHDTVQVGSVAGANLALVDHLNGATNARDVIAQRGWTYVVLQQGPTTVPTCRDSMVLWTRMFDSLITRSGAATALFMVWPSPSSIGGFDAVHTAYAHAALAVKGVFLPAGEAWRAAWEQDSTLQLYGPDNFHPSSLGTLAAALEIYERLGGRDVRTLDLTSVAPGVSKATLQLLASAAHLANQRYPAFDSTAVLLPKGPVVNVGSC